MKDHDRKSGDPSPATIAKRCAEIRAERVARAARMSDMGWGGEWTRKYGAVRKRKAKKEME
jgi:hypothetical protein